MTSTSVLKRRLLDACDQTCSLIFDEASLVSLHLMTWTSSLLKQQNTGRTRPPEPHGPERTEGAAEGLDQPRSENGWTLSSYDMPSQPARRQNTFKVRFTLSSKGHWDVSSLATLDSGLMRKSPVSWISCIYKKKPLINTKKQTLRFILKWHKTGTVFMPKRLQDSAVQGLRDYIFRPLQKEPHC